MTISALLAQIGGGSIAGYLTGPSDAAVSGAKVTALDLGRNVSVETVSNQQGYFEFPLLPAGRSRLEAELAGFQKPVRDVNSMVWLSAAAFDNNTPFAQFRFGNLALNTHRGPGGYTFDGALHKFAERHRVTFRGELFNALNHVFLGDPVLSLTNPCFGRILGGSGGRNIQLALKYQF